MAGNRRQQGAAGTKFQDLQQKAQQQGEGGGDLLSMLGDLDANDPEMLKQYEAAMAELSKLSPEELQKQMSDALNMMTEGDMVGEILKQKDAILQNLEETGAVPPEELARYKTDDAYFELKMKESFGQMQEVFQNPEYLKMATDAMRNMADVVQNPSQAMEQLSSVLGAFADDDEKIEEARLEFLQGGLDNNALFGDVFKSEEMKEVVNDPAKWRKAVKEGFQQLTAGDGAKDEL